jgi:hypothetical protein
MHQRQARAQVRRRALEGSARAPLEWHTGAIRAAYESQDLDWQWTAVFCMEIVRGFDAESFEALGNPDAGIRSGAVVAAGQWSLQEAWPHIREILTSESVDQDLLLAAIDAAGYIETDEARHVLSDLADSDDDEVADAARDASITISALDELEEFDDEFPGTGDETVH